MDTDKKNSSQLHQAHRSRIRERYIATGFDGFSPHEVLELLLFYAIPRQDVNPLAHRLIHRFGSLSRVMDAPLQELKQVDGMGPVAAQYLKLFPEVTRLYLIDRQVSALTLDTHRKVRDYLQPHFAALSSERLYILLLDNGMHPIHCQCVANGNISGVRASYREIAEIVLQYRATAVILAHNHPGGVPFPSEADKALTRSLGEFLEAMDVSLIEHFIFTDRTCVPFLWQNSGLFRPQKSDVFGKVFYETFYEGNAYISDPSDAILEITLLDTLETLDTEQPTDTDIQAPTDT